MRGHVLLLLLQLLFPLLVTAYNGDEAGVLNDSGGQQQQQPDQAQLEDRGGLLRRRQEEPEFPLPMEGLQQKSQKPRTFVFGNDLINAINDSDGVSDAVSTTIITVMGSQPPVFASYFMEGNATTATPPVSLERRIFLFQQVQTQQNDILYEIKRRYPSAKLIASATKLVNVLYVQIPDLQDYEDQPWSLAMPPPKPKSKSNANANDASSDDDEVDTIDGILSIHPHVNLELDLNVTIPSLLENTNIGASPYCTKGKGVKVAVLDTGVDYTHAAFAGGVGTRLAYESAYGKSPSSRRNRRRDGIFPTQQVYGGKDFLGDVFASPNEEDAVPDDDPIDGQGHGTYVAAHIVAMAPEARIMAVKVCSTVARSFGCPVFAILQGLEYAVDPNNDGSMNDAVDIINLSLGVSVLPAYYNELTLAVEAAFAVGVLPVVSFGNSGNKPFISGGYADSPNVLAVGATGNPRDPNRAGVMELYSSRGPGAKSHLKPDISAPSGNFAAQAGSGNGVQQVFGTSFSAPIVAGAAALLKENCPKCSPLALKTLLMNSAHRFVKANRDPTDATLAPLSWAGAGELRVKEALEADFWAYSPDQGNVQPSISLGVINADNDQTIRRKIRVRSVTSVSQQNLDISVEWRDPSHGASGAVTIQFNKEGATMQMGGCKDADSVFVSFIIDASKAPPNFLTTDRDPAALDHNEFDGHIVIRSRQTSKTIGIPFYMILRKAAKVELSTSTFELDDDDDKEDFEVELQNKGSGVAQVDAYQLLYLDGDQAEGAFGTADAPADIRSVGYRTVQVKEKGCTTMLEFAVNFWERPQHILPTFVSVVLDIGKGSNVYLVSRSTRYYVSETYVINGDGDKVCTGFAADHGVDSGNVVLRACTEHLGMQPVSGIRVGVLTLSWPASEPSDSTTWIEIDVPNAVFSAPSLDILPDQTIEIDVSYSKSSGASSELGVQFVTNAFRSKQSTGAATRETEVLFLLREGISAPAEKTPDILDFPDAGSFRGPECDWQQDACSPTPSVPTGPVPSPVRLTDFPTPVPMPSDPHSLTKSPTLAPSCLPNAVPRSPIQVADTVPGSVFACFDGRSTVQIKNRGALEMQHVRIGDKVLVESGRFESVYSFGHYDPLFLGNFLRITVSSNSSLTLSSQHMVFVKSQNFIPASLIRVGDQLLDANEVLVDVSLIEHVDSRGAFAPFTPSGKLIVNGVLASSFIAFEESPYLQSFGSGNISFQWLAHTFEFPHRIVCHYLSTCPAESYTPEGISYWVQSPFQLSLWLYKQGAIVRNTLLACCVLLAALLYFAESLLANPIILVICTVLVSRTLSRRLQR